MNSRVKPPNFLEGFMFTETLKACGFPESCRGHLPQGLHVRGKGLCPLLLVQPGLGSFLVEEGLDRESGFLRYIVQLKFGERLPRM